MSSILADQLRPSYMSPNTGGGGVLRVLSQWEQLYTLREIEPNKLWRSAPYLTYARVPCPHLKVFEAQLRGPNELVRSIVLVKNLHLNICKKKNKINLYYCSFGIMEKRNFLVVFKNRKFVFPERLNKRSSRFKRNATEHKLFKSKKFVGR